MASSISSPATRTDLLKTMPYMEMMATSVVPPPISIIMLPEAFSMGKFTPRAAAIGSSIRNTSRAPADSAESRTARFSTCVMPEGAAITTRGRTSDLRLLCTFLINSLIIICVTSKCAMTPSFIGRMVSILPEARPSICLASAPTACNSLVSELMATTEGSRRLMPFPFTKTRVFAVPRSIAKSLENKSQKKLNTTMILLRLIKCQLTTCFSCQIALYPWGWE